MTITVNVQFADVDSKLKRSSLCMERCKSDEEVREVKEQLVQRWFEGQIQCLLTSAGMAISGTAAVQFFQCQLEMKITTNLASN